MNTRTWIEISFRRLRRNPADVTGFLVCRVERLEFYATSRADAVFQLERHARNSGVKILVIGEPCRTSPPLEENPYVNPNP